MLAASYRSLGESITIDSPQTSRSEPATPALYARHNEEFHIAKIGYKQKLACLRLKKSHLHKNKMASVSTT